MKKNLLKTMSALALLWGANLSGQCTYLTNFGTATINGTTTAFTNITTCQFGGERAPITINFTCAVYSFDSSVGTDYLTFTDANNNVIAFGPTPLNNVTVPGPGNYFLHTAASGPPACTTNNSCRTTRWLASPPPCPGSAPNGTATVSNTMVCIGSSVTLSLTAGNLCGYGVQWMASNSGTAGPYANIGTGVSVNSGTLGGNMAYQAVIFCPANPANSTTTTPVTVNVGAPSMANSVANATMICPNASVALSMSSSYNGVVYSWWSSTFSNIGPWTPVTGTGPTNNVTNINTPTYYQGVVSCTAAPFATTSLNAVFVDIEGLITSTVPYFEGFEGVMITNKLPNCSWASSTPSVTQTYTIATLNGRQPFTGAKFASFRAPLPGGNAHYYTNGIQLYPGITYSANVRYISDGLVGWNELSMHYGVTQSTTNLTQIASVQGPLLNTFYKLLTNTFTVSSPGIYYIAVKAVTGAGSPAQLTWDDLEITIPCHLNPMGLAVANASTVCSGSPISLTASGADTYSWSTGDNTAAITVTPSFNGMYSVTGTSSLTGCKETVMASFNLLPAPTVGIITVNPVICAGSPAQLVAYGAVSYNWNSGPTTATLLVNPNNTTVYNVQGTNPNGCIGTASQTITVKAKPNVSILSSDADAVICEGESITLTGVIAGGGNQSFQWIAPTLFTQINPATDSPMASAIYTVTGTDANGCSNVATYALSVDPCTGLNSNGGILAGVKVYPNPANSEVTIEMNSALNKTIEISDVSGRIVMKANTSDVTVKININELSNGVYYVKIQSDKGSNVQKIVKQ